MATARTMICTLQKLQSRSCRFIYNASRAQSSTSSSSSSSWISPSKRRSLHYGRPSKQQQKQQLRPVVNGKTLTLHVNDLKAHNIAGTSSFPSQQQQRQQHRFRNNNINNTKQNKPLRKYESDLVVVLDMDECLIHSQFLQGPGAKYAHQVQQEGSSSSNGTTKSVDTFNITLPDGERVLVHERPHLHEFLREVSSKYETHIFTAAMEVYAKPVLKMLDPRGDIFTNIWYRESCQLDSTVGAYIKNLGIFCEEDDNDEERQQRLNRTVLVDNNPLSFFSHPEHGILVSSFYDDSRDTTLPAVLDLLHELDKHEDVRPVLDAKFRLRQALDDISRGRPFVGRQQQIDEQEQQQEHINIAVAT